MTGNETKLLARIAELEAENRKLASDSYYMRAALVAILAKFRHIGSGAYAQHFRDMLFLARRGLGVGQLENGTYQAAWRWVQDQGWADMPLPPKPGDRKIVPRVVQYDSNASGAPQG